MKKLKFPKKSRRCFICGKKRHYAKQCKSNKRVPAKLLQMIEDPDFQDEYYTWFDNPKHALLAIDGQSQESDVSNESNDSGDSLEDKRVFMLFEEQPVDLMMTSGPAFKPYVKVILQLLDDKKIALIALINIGAVLSIIHGNCLPRSYHLPTQISFAAASGDQFYNYKYTKHIEILLFGKRHSLFSYNSS